MTNAIIMAGQVAGALSAIGAVVYVIVKYVVVKPIQNYIDKAISQLNYKSLLNISGASPKWLVARASKQSCS